jgi:hypothetical protein
MRRQWMLTLNPTFHEIGLRHLSPLLPQAFILFRHSGVPELLVAVVVDDIFIAAVSQERIDWFKSRVKSKFAVGMFSLIPFVDNGIFVEDDGHFITLSMRDYQLEQIHVSREHRKQWDSDCTQNERHQVMSIAGRLNYLGCALSPIACQTVSETLQRLPRFKVSDLCGFNSKLCALQ